MCDAVMVRVDGTCTVARGMCDALAARIAANVRTEGVFRVPPSMSDVRGLGDACVRVV
jgi:hypothetical protein